MLLEIIGIVCVAELCICMYCIVSDPQRIIDYSRYTWEIINKKEPEYKKDDEYAHGEEFEVVIIPYEAEAR